MKELEETILKHLVERKWDQLRPGDLAKSISIEAAELLEIFQWDNPSLVEVQADPDKLSHVKKELADVLIYCIETAVLLKLDTQQIILDKLAQAQKKYPAELFQNRAEGQDAGTEDIYWQIKREHRQKGDI